MHAAPAAAQKAAASAAGFVAARITRIQTIANGVKRVNLTLDQTPPPTPPPFTFQPGQWVDFYIDDIEEITGYSMISSPLELPDLSLVVQYAKTNRAAEHVHATARCGDLIWLRSGGNVCWDATLPTAGSVLMLAGGIGVTPYCSMLQHVNVAQQHKKPIANKCALLHSSRNSVLVDDLEQMAALSPGNIYYQHSATDGTSSGSSGRLNAAAIEEALHFLMSEEVVPMCCGSVPFVKSMQSILVNDFNYNLEDVVVERWW